MYLFGGSRLPRLERRGLWKELPGAWLRGRFAGWVGAYPPRWPGARLIDRARHLELAVTVAVDTPVPGLVVALQAARTSERRIGTIWRPGVFAADGTPLFEQLRSMWTLHDSPAGTHVHLQRAGLTMERREDGVVGVTVDGFVARLEDRDPYSLELSSPFGDRGSARFDADGALVSVNAHGSSLVSELDESTRQLRALSRVDPHAAHPALSIAKDDLERIRRLVLASGEEILPDYDASGRLVSVRSSGGEELRLFYRDDAPEELARFEHSALGAWTLSPQGDGKWLAISDHAGLWQAHVDAFNLVVREMSPRAEVVEIERDAAHGAITSVSRPAGKLECFYDIEGFLVCTDESDGAHSELAYDRGGRLVKAEVPGLDRVRRVFDVHGRISSLSSRDGAHELRWSDDGASVTRARQSGDVTLTLSRGRITGVYDGAAQWSLQPSGGNVWWLASSEGQQLYFVLDAAGVQRWGTSDGWYRTIERQPNGQPLAISDALSSLRAERDRQGRVTAIGPSCTATWKPFGALIRVQVGALVEERQYGTGGGLTALHRNGEIVCLQSAQEHGRVLDAVSAHAGARLVTHDSRGRIVRVQSAGGSSAEASTRIQFEHDELGRVRDAARGASTSAFVRRNGHVESERTGGDEVRIARDHDGRRVATSTSRGLRVTMQRDAAGRVALAKWEGATEVEVAFRHDAAGREVAREIGGLAMRFQRDGLGRVVQRRVELRDRLISSTEYRWSGSVLLEQASSSGWPNHRFEHDGDGTLIAIDGTSLGARDAILFGVRVEGVEHDAIGVPKRRGREQYVHSSSGGLRIVIRDAAPEQVEMDLLGQLGQITGDERTVEYQRDAFGRLVCRAVRRYRQPEPIEGPSRRLPSSTEPVLATESTMRIVWDGPRPVHRWTEGGSEVTHVWIDGLLVLHVVAGEPYVVVPDQAGDPEALLSVRGDLVWARDARTLVYGLADAGADKYGLPSLADHFFDAETGYWESLFRTFDAATARYLIPNPLGLSAGPGLFALCADPIRRRTRRGVGSALPFWSELDADTFDLRWVRFVLEQLGCRADERGLRGWRSFDDELVPDPQRWLMEVAGLMDA